MAQFILLYKFTKTSLQKNIISYELTLTNALLQGELYKELLKRFTFYNELEDAMKQSQQIQQAG